VNYLKEKYAFLFAVDTSTPLGMLLLYPSHLAWKHVLPELSRQHEFPTLVLMMEKRNRSSAQSQHLFTLMGKIKKKNNTDSYS
jgi:hypothetical protein